jgi:O-antigen biosynthesis protein
MNEINPKADIQIAVLVDEKTLLLFGWIDRTLPSSGTASFSDGADSAGTYDGHFWPRDEASLWFVALLRFDDIAQIRPQRLSIVGADHGTRYTIPPIQNIKINPWTLLTTLKEDMPEAMPVVFDFLHTSLSETAQSERTTRLMLAFLQSMAQPDGFVEIFGCMTGLGTLMQGWSFNLTAGEHDLLIETEGCRTFSSTIGSFDRSDLPSTARGVLGVMIGADTLDLGRIRRIYHKAAKGWCYLEIFENHTLLNDQSAVPHLRAMLPTLTGEPGVLRTLKRLSNAQYEGFETVSRLEIPVRVGLDTAVRVPGAGTLVTGWVLDPDHHVSAITLKGIGVSARIDLDWCRANRRDVSEAFAKDALFAGKILAGEDAHGFLSFVPEPADSPEQCERYLELSLTDDACAFMPVATSKSGAPALRRLLSTIDLNDPASETIISRHIGPLVQAAGRSQSTAEAFATVYTMGKVLPSPRVSVIVPIADGRDDIDVTLAKLAIDRDFRDTEIIIASGAGAHERLSPSLRRFAGFYNLSIKLVPCPQAHDIYQAMDAGVRHAASDMLLLLSPSILPTSTGWLSDLEWAYKTCGKNGMVSPTLLYEDFSIRFAGIQQISAQSAVSQYAGYSRDWLKGREIATVQAASTDCALIPRAAFLDAGGFSDDFVGTDFKGVDFCLKLRAAGHTCLWLPTVQLIALDETPREQTQEYWLQTGGLVDRWGFERKWPRLHTTQSTSQSLGSIDR